MEYEWDSAKAAANEAKHGVRFSIGVRVFDDAAHVVLDTTRAADGEFRTKAVGLIGNRLFTVVFTMRGETCRIISARRSNAKEEKAYDHRAI